MLSSETPMIVAPAALNRSLCSAERCSQSFHTGRIPIPNRVLKLCQTSSRMLSTFCPPSNKQEEHWHEDQNMNGGSNHAAYNGGCNWSHHIGTNPRFP